MSYQLTRFTDRNRRGSERCPYCGGYHYSDAQFNACAREHSYRDRTYRCERCGKAHLTLAQADRCCEVEKRFEIKYDSGYTDPDPYSAGDSGNTSGGIFDSFFNAGSNQDSTNTGNSGGILDSFFDAGGNKGSSNGSGWFG